MADKADFKTVCEKANEILVCANSIKTFPFPMRDVINEMTDIVMMPFSSIEIDGISAEDILCSKDAALEVCGGRHIIFYNEKMPVVRRRFSEGHELGHYYLGHDIERVSEMRRKRKAGFDNLYAKCEVEANFFSAQLHMPEQLLIMLAKRGRKITKEFLMGAFGVSESAAEKRMRTFNKTYSWWSFKKPDDGSFDDIVLEKFKPFIDSLAPRKQTYEYDVEKELAMERERQTWN